MVVRVIGLRLAVSLLLTLLIVAVRLWIGGV